VRGALVADSPAAAADQHHVVGAERDPVHRLQTRQQSLDRLADRAVRADDEFPPTAGFSSYLQRICVSTRYPHQRDADIGVFEVH